MTPNDEQLQAAREEAKKEAWKASIFGETPFQADLRRKNIVRDIFNEGFDAGYAAAEQAASVKWVPINGPEDLPKVQGRYVTIAGDDPMPRVDYFHPERSGKQTDWLGYVIAYMPIPPYIAKAALTSKEQADER